MNITGWISNNYIEIFGAATGIIYVFLEIRQSIWLWPVGIITSGVYIWVFFTGKIYADMSLQVYYLVISVLGWYWWVMGTGRRTQDAGRRAQDAGHRTQDAGRRTQDAGLRTQDAGLRTQDAGRRAQDAGQNKNSYFEEPIPNRRQADREGQGDVKTGDKFAETSDKLAVTRLKLKTGIILMIVFILLFTLMWQFLGRLTDSPVPARDAFITSLSIIATWMLARKIYEHWFLWIAVNSASVALFISRGLYPTVLLYMVYCAMSFVGLIAWKRSLRKR